jgi:hypothetical protein
LAGTRCNEAIPVLAAPRREHKRVAIGVGGFAGIATARPIVRGCRANAKILPIAAIFQK